MSGQIGTGIDFFATSGGAGGGKFGIEDNSSDIDRSVDMGGKSLSLNNIREFNLTGSESVEFVPYEFDEIQEIENIEFYNVVPFPGYPDNSLVRVMDETITAGAYDITVYFDVDGIEQDFTFDYFLLEGEIPFPVYLGPLIEGEIITLLGYDKLSKSPVNINAKLPDGDITNKKVVFVDGDNKLRKGSINLSKPSWMDTLNEDASLTGNVYSYMESGVAFNIYGTNPYSPIWFFSNNTNQILAKFQVGVGANGFLESGLSFFNDRTDVRRPIMYQLDDNSYMVQYDRTLPDSGFVRGQWSYTKEISTPGLSSLGSTDYYVELFPNADYTLYLDKAVFYKGKKYLIKNSGLANVILQVTSAGTINGKNLIVLIPGTALEVIHNGTEYRILWGHCKVTINDINVAQTAADLNALCPDALEGFEIYCPNIMPAILYRKTGWVGAWIGIEPKHILLQE